MVPNLILAKKLEVILFAKNKVAAITSWQIHNHLTRNRLDYHQLSHNLEIYNSRPVTAGCKLYNKLPAHIKLIRDGRLFKKEAEGAPPKKVLLLNWGIYERWLHTYWHLSLLFKYGYSSHTFTLTGILTSLVTSLWSHRVHISVFSCFVLCLTLDLFQYCAIWS
jgi:hypothetical protein